MDEATITDAVRKGADQSVLCWMATLDPEGYPNVSPKELWLVHSDRDIVVANIASPNTERNVRHNPAVCLSFIDIFRQKGFKLTGTAQILEKEAPRFADSAGALLDLAGDRFPIKNVFLITVTKSAAIIAPSYYLHQATEAEMMAQSALTYRVHDLPRDQDG